MVAGIDGGDGECAIGLNRTDQSLIDQDRGSGNSALDGQRGGAGLGLKIRDGLGGFVFANADRLRWRILKATLWSIQLVWGFDGRSIRNCGFGERDFSSASVWNDGQ